MKTKTLWIFIVIIMLSFSSTAHAEWNFGIGTGLQALSTDGTMGFDTSFGPVEVDIDMDADNIFDSMEAAFGLNGYAANGDWQFQFAFGHLELEGSATKGIVWSKVNYKITTGEFATAYTFYKTSPFKLNLIGGLRYTDHDLDSDVTIGGSSSHSTIENDWTDAVVGISADFLLAENWSWNNRFDAGFGGSEGTYTFHSGLTWRFLQNWSSTLFFKHMAVEFENGSRGASNWYLYDVDETYFGLGIFYNW